MERTERWVRYLITFLWVCLFMAITGCENTRQSIGISTKPLQSGEDFENSTKKQKKRMKKFNEEVSHWNEYDYVVVNDDLELCYNQILNIIMSEIKGVSQTQNSGEIAKLVQELIK